MSKYDGIQKWSLNTLNQALFLVDYWKGITFMDPKQEAAKCYSIFVLICLICAFIKYKFNAYNISLHNANKNQVTKKGEGSIGIMSGGLLETLLYVF